MGCMGPFSPMYLFQDGLLAPDALTPPPHLLPMMPCTSSCAKHADGHRELPGSERSCNMLNAVSRRESEGVQWDGCGAGLRAQGELTRPVKSSMGWSGCLASNSEPCHRVTWAWGPGCSEFDPESAPFQLGDLQMRNLFEPQFPHL